MDDTSGTRIKPVGLLGDGTMNKSLRYLLVLLVLGFAWRAIFMYRDPAWVTDFWLFEDFGYSLKIARNIALGLGETFDGVVHTNGYQPLYVWLMVPVFWAFKTSLLGPMYIAMSLLALANVATGAFIFAILRRLTGQAMFALLGAAFWMFNFAVAKDGTNGLEAGLSTMMLAATLHYYFKHHHKDMALWRALVLGLLLGLSFLARVDAVFLAAAILVGMLADRTIPVKQRLALVVLAGIGFLAAALPYGVWNMTHFGSPLPTSGQVTTGKTSLFAFGDLPFAELLVQFEYGCYIVMRMLSGAPSANGWVNWPSALGEITATLLVIGLGAIAWLLLVWKTKPSTLARKAGLVLGLAAVLYMYGYTIHTFVPFERYFLPVVLVVTLIVPLVAHTFFNIANRAATTRRIVVFTCLGAAYFVNAGLAYLSAPGAEPIGWYDGVMKLNEITQPGDIVAAMQTGNTGYFYTKGRAINIDGVVNLEAYRSRQAGNIDAYLRQENVRYIADEHGFIFKMINSVKDQVRRDRLLASLVLRHWTPGTQYKILELTPDIYTKIRQLTGQGWTKQEKQGFIGGYATVSAAPGARLDFSSSSCFALKFLKHGWSGKVDVLKDGVKLTTLNLYAPVEDVTFRQAFQQDGMPHTYSLIVSDEKDPRSQGKEVWFDAVLDQPPCSGAGVPAQ